MFYPGLVGLTCESCQKYQYRYKPDDPKQKINSYELEYEKRNGRKTDTPLARAKGSIPPCFRCPKVNPIQGAEIEKAIPKAQRLLEIYNQSQGTNGKYLPSEPDALLIRNLGIVHDMVEQKKQLTIAESVLPLLLRG